jgi:uncharacterized protein YidB (DUF937 family)
MSGGLDDLLQGLGSGKGGGVEDLLGGLLGGSSGSGAGGAGLGGVMAALGPILGQLLSGGGLEKLLQGFQSAGMGDKVDSWVSTGANEPLSADEVRQAVSPEQLAEIAQRLGVDEERAAGVIADVVPGLVDRVSPEGALASKGELDTLGGLLQSVQR